MLFTQAIKQRWRDRLELKVVEWAHFRELHRRYIQNTLEAEQDERQTADRRTANESALEFGPNHSFGLSSKDSILLLVRYCVSWICPFTTDRLTYLWVDMQRADKISWYLKIYLFKTPVNANILNSLVHGYETCLVNLWQTENKNLTAHSFIHSPISVIFCSYGCSQFTM